MGNLETYGTSTGNLQENYRNFWNIFQDPSFQVENTEKLTMEENLEEKLQDCFQPSYQWLGMDWSDKETLKENTDFP